MEEPDKLFDLWEDVNLVKDDKWRLMLKLLYKIDDHFDEIAERLEDIKNCLVAQ